MSVCLRGVLLCLLAAAVYSEDISNVEFEDRDLSNELPYEAILYAYKTDSDSPNYLTRGDVIFDVDRDEDVSIYSNARMEQDLVYSDSESTAAQNIASSLDVEGSYGAFSASASMQASKDSSSRVKTVRFDATMKAIKYGLSSKGPFRTYPEEFLTENFNRTVKGKSVEHIADTIGEFYATEMDLGGEIRKSYTMEATENDDKTSVQAELEASYGKGLFQGSVKAGVSYESRSTNKDANLKIKWAYMGGKATVLLGKTLEETGVKPGNALQGEWANTFTDDNLYPTNFKLSPIWEMIKYVDANKGAEMEKYLKEKWEKQKNSFHPTIFLPAGCVKDNTRMSNHIDSRKMINREECQKWCDSRWECKAITMGTGICFLMDNVKLDTNAMRNQGWTSMVRSCWDKKSVCISAYVRSRGDIAHKKFNGYEDCRRWCDSRNGCDGITIGTAWTGGIPATQHRCYLLRKNASREYSTGWGSALKSCWKTK